MLAEVFYEKGKRNAGGGKVKIIGIDASLTSTGIAVFNGILTQTAAIQSKKFGTDRLIEIRERAKVIIDGADLVAIEGYAFARPNQSHQIGELGGVLRVLFHEMKLKVLEVAPSQVKKFATGKGNADKEKMAVAVYKRWGREFATNDECDAFVLTEIGRAYFSQANNLIACQQEVVNELISGKPKKSRKKAV